MTPAHARTAANIVVVTAGLAAAWIVLTTPPLRRLAGRALRLWLGASVPAYVAAEVREAWLASGRERPAADFR